MLTSEGRLIIEVPWLLSQRTTIHKFREFTEPDIWSRRGDKIVYSHSFSKDELYHLIQEARGSLCVPT